MPKHVTPIYNKIKQGLLPQGYELEQGDIGYPLGDSFGRVLDVDVGKRVYVKPYGLAMENVWQMDRRKRNEENKNNS